MKSPNLGYKPGLDSVLESKRLLGAPLAPASGNLSEQLRRAELGWGDRGCVPPGHSLTPQGPPGQPIPPPRPTLRGSGRRAGGGRPSNCPQVYSLPCLPLSLACEVCVSFFHLHPSPRSRRGIFSPPLLGPKCAVRGSLTHRFTHTHTVQ